MKKENEYKKAKEWALNNLVGKKIFHKDINDFILFSADGVNHAIYAKTYDEKIKMIYDAQLLLKNSKLYSIEKDKKNRPDVKAIYKFVSNWNDTKKIHIVYIVVRETKQGKFYYDHGIIKEKP